MKSLEQIRSDNWAELGAAKEFFEATGLDFYNDIEPVVQRKLIENYMEDHDISGEK